MVLSTWHPIWNFAKVWSSVVKIRRSNTSQPIRALTQIQRPIRFACATPLAVLEILFRFMPGCVMMSPIASQTKQKLHKIYPSIWFRFLFSLSNSEVHTQLHCGKTMCGLSLSTGLVRISVDCVQILLLHNVLIVSFRAVLNKSKTIFLNLWDSFFS